MVIENANNNWKIGQQLGMWLTELTEVLATWQLLVKLVAAISRLSCSCSCTCIRLAKQQPQCRKRDLLSGASRNVHNEALK